MISGVAFAQEAQTALPSAGITPESPFYFVDQLGEALRKFFTFSPAGKARLEITFAAERVAEIKVILEDKGVSAKGLDVAQDRLRDHLSRTSIILEERKNLGENVSALAKELGDGFAGPKTELERTYKEEKRALKAKEQDLKERIVEARQAGDTALENTLTAQLEEVKAQRKLLEQKEEEHSKEIEDEEESLNEQMEAKDEALKQMAEVEKKRAEMIREAAKDGVTLPATAFASSDSLLAQAKAAFDQEKYEDAKRLAKQAKKALENVEEVREELEKAEEEADELMERVREEEKEVSEKLEEADKKMLESINEQIKQSEERLNEEQKQTEEEAKRAEEALKELDEQ